MILIIFGVVSTIKAEQNSKEVEKKKQQDIDKAHEKNIAELKPDKVIRADKVLDNVAIYISNLKNKCYLLVLFQI